MGRGGIDTESGLGKERGLAEPVGDGRHGSGPWTWGYTPPRSPAESDTPLGNYRLLSQFVGSGQVRRQFALWEDPCLGSTRQ